MYINIKITIIDIYMKILIRFLKLEIGKLKREFQKNSSQYLFTVNDFPLI